MQLPPPALALRPDFPEVWKRLRDPTLHRPFRITCWRMLHARLGCNAFLYHVRKSGSPLCSHPACAAAGDVETLTHAFLLCPAVRPVIDWMLGTWHRLAGVKLPRAPELILADDPSHGWPVGAGRPAFRLWTRLRGATLGAIWQARCSRGTYQASFARHAVTLAVDSLLQAIRRDWRRTQEDPRLLDNGAFCNDWWRGFDARLKVGDFERQWALPPIFCGLEGARPPAGADDHRRLEMKLGRDRPLARPPSACVARRREPKAALQLLFSTLQRREPQQQQRTTDTRAPPQTGGQRDRGTKGQDSVKGSNLRPTRSPAANRDTRNPAKGAPAPLPLKGREGTDKGAGKRQTEEKGQRNSKASKDKGHTQKHRNKKQTKRGVPRGAEQTTLTKLPKT